MTCPDTSCVHTIGVREMNRFFADTAEDKALVEKHQKFMLEATITDGDDYVRCINPQGCENAMIVDDAGQLRVQCNECGYVFCRDCQEAWHDDSTCERYQEWKKANADTDGN